MSIGRIAVLAVTAVFVVGVFSTAIGGIFNDEKQSPAAAGIDLR